MHRISMRYRCLYSGKVGFRFIPSALMIAGFAMLSPPAIAQTQGIEQNILPKVAALIFRNECASHIACLTAWNRGEEFASLGIGHFIWYPADVPEQDKHFKESFPALLNFMHKKGVKTPNWLKKAHGLPWKSRKMFIKEQKSIKMINFRLFLKKTMSIQADFMQIRLKNALPLMLASTPINQRAHIRRQFERVAAAPMGAYALTDYVNFKGEGTRASERYQGRGWGLMQVLGMMRGDESGLAAIREFSRAAVFMLQQRVAHSPPARHEARWLPGWKKRIASYVSEAESSLH